MNTLRTILVDDEEDARVILSSYLDTYCPEVEIIARASGMDEAVRLIDDLQPELVFLDVKMHPGTGFDVLEQVTFTSFQTIFITAYDEYAVRAIKVSALDFLLKPIDSEELVAAVEKVRSRVDSTGSSDVRYQIARDEFAGDPAGHGRMVLPTQEGFQVVDIESIVRCEADRNYTIFWFEDGNKALISRTLKFYEELLSGSGFFRIHQSHLLNLSFIVEYKRRKKGGIVILKDRTELPVAETRKMNFQKMFLR